MSSWMRLTFLSPLLLAGAMTMGDGYATSADGAERVRVCMRGQCRSVWFNGRNGRNGGVAYYRNGRNGAVVYRNGLNGRVAYMNGRNGRLAYLNGRNGRIAYRNGRNGRVVFEPGARMTNGTRAYGTHRGVHREFVDFCNFRGDLGRYTCRSRWVEHSGRHRGIGTPRALLF